LLLPRKRYNHINGADEPIMGLPKPILTEDEYLTLERAAHERHQYVDGEIFAMAGESSAHGDITSNVQAHFTRNCVAPRAGRASRTRRSAAVHCLVRRSVGPGSTPTPISS
jgi:hypothetical protein